MALARGVSASQAQEYYYEKDPISAPDGKGENSEWFGSLQEDFELAGRVGSDNFVSLLSGLDPKSQKQIVKAGVNEERRAGIDLAFSAPKSVSICALHKGDKRILDAHREAVKVALKFVEENYIVYREKVGSDMHYIKSDNMIAGTFLHTTSRANDPQLHTHAVILNVTKSKDGKFKAISNEQIFKYQKLINNVYQNSLAANLQELGYAIENYENKFEIKGVSDEAIEAFSKRSREIDNLYEKLVKRYPDKSEAELMDIAVLNSRQSKDKDMTSDKLSKSWELEIPKDNINPILKSVVTPKEISIQNAINQVIDNESAFNKHQLLNVLLTQNRGSVTLKELEEEIKKLKEEKKIIELGFDKANEKMYSTPEMIKIESEIVQATKSGKDSAEALLKDNEFLDKLPKNLTEGQRAFVVHALTSKDKINIIQGDAGTGKTYAVKTINDILKAEDSDVKIVGLGFTGKAAQELSKAAGIETSTIASYLFQKDVPKNSIIIVDEASMVSSKDMLSVIEKSNDNRIIFIGDGKQLQAIGAGKMFKELQKENIIKTIKMEEVLRQETKTMIDLVKNIKNYQDDNDKNGLDKTFKILEKEKLIIEQSSKSKEIEVDKMFLFEKALKEYDKNQDTLILTSSRAMKDELNKKIRKNVLTEGELKTSITIKTRQNVSASGYIAASYKSNDIVSLDNKEWRVSKINKDKNLIALSRFNSKTKKQESKIIEPSKCEFIAYREEEKTFARGDKIIFTKNDKKLKVQNGLNGVIEKIDGKIAEVKIKDRLVKFNLDKYSYLDYGYAQTIHKSQGQTSEKAILVHNAGDNLSTEAFYVAATRAKKEFKVITNDKAQFQKSVGKEQIKTSTREFSKN